jgi:hypothetical protein
MKKEWEKCDPGCRGWFLDGDTHTPTRCDECARFDSDLEAFKFAVAEDLAHLQKEVCSLSETRQREIQVTRALKERDGVDYWVGYHGSSKVGVHEFLVMLLDKSHRQGRAFLMPSGSVLGPDDGAAASLFRMVGGGLFYLSPVKTTCPSEAMPARFRADCVRSQVDIVQSNA